MKVIGAGLPKTGTTSLAAALRILGYSVHDHMEHIGYNFDNYVDLLNGDVEVDILRDMYRDIDAVTDSPSCHFFRDLHRIFPDAKVILTVRDSEEQWVKSQLCHLEYFLKTHWWCNWRPYAALLGALSPLTRKIRRFYGQLVCLSTGTDNFSLVDPHSCSPPRGLSSLVMANRYFMHNTAVSATLPPDTLLVFNVKEGWVPLCQFLGQPVPDCPFPRENKAITDGTVPIIDWPSPIMLYWRMAGLNYLQFSKIAAAAMRRGLKPEVKEAALKLEQGGFMKTKWQSGKPIKA